MPCNVVVSADGEARSPSRSLDPATMEEFTGTARLGPIAATARQRLTEMLEKLVA